ncbi:MAG: hypothetical protein Q9222_005500 [Ikaeria aurantiellina]
MTAVSYLLAFVIIILTTTLLRLLYILPATNPTAPLPRRRGQKTRLLIVLGSGGHTTEMLALLHELDPSVYTHRSYVVSSGDEFSALKAVEFEERLAAQGDKSNLAVKHFRSTYDISTVPRARQIHQSLLTTPISSLRCLYACFAVLRAPSTQRTIASNPTQEVAAQQTEEAIPYTYPHLIIANGPATAALVILASLLLRFSGLRGAEGMRSIYVESWARVNTLSLSGRILLGCGMVNRVLVQWESLARSGRGEFRGPLVR